MIEEEARFCRLLREGQPAAMEEMVESYGDRLLRGAFFLCRNEPEAQDLVHDTSSIRHLVILSANPNLIRVTMRFHLSRAPKELSFTMDFFMPWPKKKTALKSV
jgi:hypothetical protein